MPEDRILIAGGGIGGVAAALGLARKGFRSLVMEQMPELKEIGAGIQLGPNAFHSFDYFGVGDAAREKAREDRRGEGKRHGHGGKPWMKRDAN